MRSSRFLYSLAASLMAIFAILAVLSALAFITVRWPGDTGRYVKVALAGSITGFVASAAVAVLAAARNTYGGARVEREPDD